VAKGLTYREVNSLVITPSNPQVLYAGTWKVSEGAESGVFKSTNGGESWVAKNSGLTNLYVWSLAMDPSNPQVLYAGTLGGGGGVFKSTDGGESWVQKNNGLPSYPFVESLAIDPSNPQVLYADSGGVFKSTNGGESWVAKGLTGPEVDSLAIDPSNPQVVYAGTWGLFKWIPSSGITVTSPNGGESWTIGSTKNITWTSSNLTGNVKIELNRNYPSGTWEVLFASTPNDGNESWQVTGPASSSCRIRISSLDDPSVYDISDGNFTIEEGTPGPAHMPSLSPWGLALLGVSLLTVAAFGITGAKRKKA
jgi:hypothetical protein